MFFVITMQSNGYNSLQLRVFHLMLCNFASMSRFKWVRKQASVASSASVVCQRLLNILIFAIVAGQLTDESSHGGSNFSQNSERRRCHSPEGCAVGVQNKATNVQPNPSIQLASDWQEHTSGDGRRYYYNKKTKQSSWEKPVELMTPIERADASTDWKEFTNSDGRKYYYNKVTKQSKWTIPNELKLAREQAEREASQGILSESAVVSQPQVSLTVPLSEPSFTPSSAPSGTTTSPVSVTPTVAVGNQPTAAAFGSPSLPVLSTNAA